MLDGRDWEMGRRKLLTLVVLGCAMLGMAQATSADTYDVTTSNLLATNNGSNNYTITNSTIYYSVARNGTTVKSGTDTSGTQDFSFKGTFSTATSLGGGEYEGTVTVSSFKDDVPTSGTANTPWVSLSSPVTLTYYAFYTGSANSSSTTIMMPNLVFNGASISGLGNCLRMDGFTPFASASSIIADMDFATPLPSTAGAGLVLLGGIGVVMLRARRRSVATSRGR